MINLVDLAYAQAPAGESGGDVNQMINFLLPMILIFAVFYFLMVRPQQKRAKEHKQMLDNLKKGDAVITQGGIYGKIVTLEPSVVTLEIADKVRVRVARSHIAGLGASGVSEPNP
jgi:preprotein translocase subunit YajC